MTATQTLEIIVASGPCLVAMERGEKIENEKWDEGKIDKDGQIQCGLWFWSSWKLQYKSWSKAAGRFGSNPGIAWFLKAAWTLASGTQKGAKTKPAMRQLRARCPIYFLSPGLGLRSNIEDASLRKISKYRLFFQYIIKFYIFLHYDMNLPQGSPSHLSLLWQAFGVTLTKVKYIVGMGKNRARDSVERESWIWTKITCL